MATAAANVRDCDVRDVAQIINLLQTEETATGARGLGVRALRGAGWGSHTSARHLYEKLHAVFVSRHPVLRRAARAPSTGCLPVPAGAATRRRRRQYKVEAISGCWGLRPQPEGAKPQNRLQQFTRPSRSSRLGVGWGGVGEAPHTPGSAPC